MVFRFKPLKVTTNPHSDWSQPIGDKLITQVINNQFKSTYSTDYVNNVEEKQKFEERDKQLLRPTTAAQLLKWKSMRELEQKRSIQPMPINQPFSYESLYISPTRYGSNIKHQQAAVGIVPGCSRFWNVSQIN